MLRRAIAALIGGAVAYIVVVTAMRDEVLMAILDLGLALAMYTAVRAIRRTGHVFPRGLLIAAGVAAPIVLEFVLPSDNALVLGIGVACAMGLLVLSAGRSRRWDDSRGSDEPHF